MQVNRYIALPKSSFFSSKLFVAVRLVLFLLILIYLWQAALDNAVFLTEISNITLAWSVQSIFFLIAAIVLLPVNWLLEGKKWQLLAKSRISFPQAMEGVLIGITLDNVLPFGTGGISGRILSIQKKYRYDALPGILVGQILQSAVTLGFGLIGFYLVWSRNQQLLNWRNHYSLAIIGLGLVGVLAVIFWKDRFVKFLHPLKTYPVKSWLLILLISTLRYLVFLIQFYLLGLFFVDNVSGYLILSCATWVFAARTFMPKVTNLERLGIRALAVLFFAKVLSISAAGLLVTVGVLWFINLAVPSIIGLWYLPRLKREAVFN